MRWRTCFSSVSYFGYKIDILKSAVQKYLRRREEDKMLWCVAEIYLFHVMASSESEKRASKAIVTNLINRLIIMMDEELLFTEWERYLRCRSLLEEFEKSGRGNFKALIKVCRLLVRGELLRLTSDIAGYYLRGIQYRGVSAPFKTYRKLRKGLFGLTYAMRRAVGLTKKGDVDRVILLMANFIEYFKKGDTNCFHWSFRIYEMGQRKQKGATRFRRNGCEYILWEYLLEECRDNTSLRKCVEYRLKEFFVKHRTAGARHMWLNAAIMLVMNKEKINWQPCLTDLEVTDEDIRRIYKERVKLKIDDYAIDMHCSAGRKMGKNKTDFITSGGIVIDENKEWFRKEWREIDIGQDHIIRSDL